jgi:sulfur carrier protein ThiS
LTAKLIFRDQEYEVKHGMTVRHALVQIEIPPESVLATRDDELITDDELLQEGDSINLIAVISGGC